jgi:hypothetical protein
VILVANSAFAQCSDEVHRESGWIAGLSEPHSPLFASRGRRSGEFATSINSRVTRGHLDQEPLEMAVARHVAAVPTLATDFCDTKSDGIPSGCGLSQISELPKEPQD